MKENKNKKKRKKKKKKKKGSYRASHFGGRRQTWRLHPERSD